jgi:hypothetical protein
MKADTLEQLIYRWIANRAVGNILVTNKDDEELRDAFINEIITRTLAKHKDANIVFISNRDVRLLDHKNIECFLPVDIYSKLSWRTELFILDTYNMSKDSINTITNKFKAKWQVIITYHGDCISHQIKYPLLNYVAPKLNYVMYGVKLSSIIYNQYLSYNEEISNIMNKFDITDDEASSIKGISNRFQLIAACNKGINVRTGTGFTQFSPQYFRRELAYLCGWDEELDISIDIFKDIEDNYNPSAIGEAANAYMRVLKSRKALLATNDDKTQSIINLITDNKDKSIIVWNESYKSSDSIHSKLNALGIRNGNIHNYVKGVELHDDKGHVIQTSSGSIKAHGKTGVRKHYIRQYNECVVKVLNIANKQPATIKLEHCDLLILNGYNLDLSYILRSKILSFTTNKQVDIVFIYNEKTNDYDRVKSNINKYRVPIRLRRGILKK